jgi:hypothetical protein
MSTLIRRLRVQKAGVGEIVHWSSERGSADEQVKALWYRILYHQWGLTWVQTRALLVRVCCECSEERDKKKKDKKLTQNIVPTTDNRHYFFTFKKISVLGVSN